MTVVVLKRWACWLIAQYWFPRNRLFKSQVYHRIWCDSRLYNSCILPLAIFLIGFNLKLFSKISLSEISQIFSLRRLYHKPSRNSYFSLERAYHSYSQYACLSAKELSMMQASYRTTLHLSNKNVGDSIGYELNILINLYKFELLQVTYKTNGWPGPWGLNHAKLVVWIISLSNSSN